MTKYAAGTFGDSALRGPGEEWRLPELSDPSAGANATRPPGGPRRGGLWHTTRGTGLSPAGPGAAPDSRRGTGAGGIQHDTGEFRVQVTMVVW